MEKNLEIAMNHSYANYVCRLLFDKSCCSNQIKLLDSIFSNYEKFFYQVIPSNALYFMFDNELDKKCEEKIISFFNTLDISKLLDTKVLRLLEPTVTFKQADTSFIENLIINNLKKLLEKKEGYFLVKKYCKNIKNSQSQIRFVEKLISLPAFYLSRLNESLISQSVLVNFQLLFYELNDDKNINMNEIIKFKEYYTNKLYLEKEKYSDSIISIMDEMKESQRKSKPNDYFNNKSAIKYNQIFNRYYKICKKNSAIKQLIKYLVDNLFSMKLNQNSFKLLNVAIVYGGETFQKYILKKILKRKDFLIKFILLNKHDASKILNNMIEMFTFKSKYILSEAMYEICGSLKSKLMDRKVDRHITKKLLSVGENERKLEDVCYCLIDELNRIVIKNENSLLDDNYLEALFSEGEIKLEECIKDLLEVNVKKRVKENESIKKSALNLETRSIKINPKLFEESTILKHSNIEDVLDDECIIDPNESLKSNKESITKKEKKKKLKVKKEKKGSESNSNNQIPNVKTSDKHMTILNPNLTSQANLGVYSTNNISMPVQMIQLSYPSYVQGYYPYQIILPSMTSMQNLQTGINGISPVMYPNSNVHNMVTNPTYLKSFSPNILVYNPYLIQNGNYKN